MAITFSGSTASALDPDLTVIGALSPAANDMIQYRAGAWANRTPAQIKADLALVKADVGLSSVDNTTDLGKPISTLTQAALDLKATDSAVVKLTGTQTVAGAKTFTNPLVINGSVSGQASLTLQHTGAGGNRFILTTSAGQWMDYMDGGAIDRHFSDPFGKDHMLLAPATGAGNGLTTFDSGLKVVGNAGFYNTAPVAKAGATADLKASLVALGLITGGGAAPLNLGAGALTAGAGSFTTLGTSSNATIAGTLNVTGAVVLSSGMTLANEVYARLNDATNQVKIGFIGAPAKAGIAFGSAEDAYVYRASAGALVTNGSFAIAGNVGFYNQAATAKPTGVAVSIAAVHAALVTLNLIAA